MKKLNNDEFIEKCKSIHKDRYDYSNTKYVNMRTKLLVICEEHGEFLILPYNHINNQGCKKCSDTNHKLVIISNERLLNMRETHNNKYDYNNLNVVDGKITITCKEHGDFEQIIYHHEKGHGCYECYLDDRRIVKYKVCNICNISKELSSFKKGYRKCKDCLEIKVENKVCRICNKYKSIDEYPMRTNEEYRNECKCCYDILHNNSSKKYRQKNKSVLREKGKKYHKNRLETDVLYRLKVSTRNLIRKSLTKRGYTKKSRTYEILGCSYIELKRHIEKLFLPGMTWENRNLWHIDHIIPLDFGLNENELLQLNNFTNLRPLWGNINLKKSNYILEKTELYYQILENRETIIKNII